jgi:hypothetical protein
MIHLSLPLGAVLVQSSEFCRHNPLCLLLNECLLLFRYRLSPETFGYTHVSGSGYGQIVGFLVNTVMKFRVP